MIFKRLTSIFELFHSTILTFCYRKIPIAHNATIIPRLHNTAISDCIIIFWKRSSRTKERNTPPPVENGDIPIPIAGTQTQEINTAGLIPVADARLTTIGIINGITTLVPSENRLSIPDNKTIRIGIILKQVHA